MKSNKASSIQKWPIIVQWILSTHHLNKTQSHVVLRFLQTDVKAKTGLRKLAGEIEIAYSFD